MSILGGVLWASSCGFEGSVFGMEWLVYWGSYES